MGKILGAFDRLIWMIVIICIAIFLFANQNPVELYLFPGTQSLKLSAPLWVCLFASFTAGAFLAMVSMTLPRICRLWQRKTVAVGKAEATVEAGEAVFEGKAGEIQVGRE